MTLLTQFRLILIGAALSIVISPSRAQLITHRDLSYATAKMIAETSIDSCKASGYSVSAVVVYRAGEVIVALRGDNASPHTMENARRKAYTARSFRTSTTAYAKRFVDNDPVVRQQVTLPNVIAIPGGLPIKVGDDVVGGAGYRVRPESTSSVFRRGSTRLQISSNEPIARRASRVGNPGFTAGMGQS